MESTERTIAEHRLDAGGADHLLLAGVNDANLQELARVFGVRVVLRGDDLILSGEAHRVERAAPVVLHLIELARLRSPFDARDVSRIAEEFDRRGDDVGTVLRPSELRIALPGSRRVITPKSAGQTSYLEAIGDFDIVIGIGPAGTGKTYLAVAAAVDALYRKRVKRIVLARPAVEAGESLGFLPGDMQEKVDPYLRPLYDALEDMMPSDRVQRVLEDRTIEIAPLAYMRGRTLSDAFVILDEAQNATTAQMKMFLTRLGLNSKVVITGDKTQIDLPRRSDSGLLEVERILTGIDGIAFVYLDGTDVIRHRLVKDIIRAYARAEEAEESP
jgi:phosphate starvation-inducible PhoH-like protein